MTIAESRRYRGAGPAPHGPVAPALARVGVVAFLGFGRGSDPLVASAAVPVDGVEGAHTDTERWV
jgi:hypothetical protein